MMQQLRRIELYLLIHDEPTLDATAACFQNYAVEPRPILWIMQGDGRILPDNVVLDALRLVEERRTLGQLDRTGGIPRNRLEFTRLQTVSLSEYEPDNL